MRTADWELWTINPRLPRPLPADNCDGKAFTMSWGGFKKSINRAGTQLMQKTGQLERSEDSRFKEEELKYREFEKHTTALLKNSRDYLDAIRCMSAR